MQVDFKLLPHDAEMPIAPYFRLERKTTLAGVNEIIGDALLKLGAIKSEVFVHTYVVFVVGRGPSKENHSLEAIGIRYQPLSWLPV